MQSGMYVEANKYAWAELPAKPPETLRLGEGAGRLPSQEAGISQEGFCPVSEQLRSAACRDEAFV